MKTKQTFEEHLRKSNLSENTITSYLWTVNYFHSHYDEVNKENLLAYKGYLMEFFKPKTVNLRIQGINKVYTRDEMREEHIITTDYHFIDKEGEYFAKLIMRAEASKNMMRLFFQLSDGRKIITPVFWWQSYLGFYEIDNGTNLRLIYEKNGKGIALKKIEILD